MEINQYIWDVVDSNSWLVTEHNHGLLIDAVDNPQLFDKIRTLETLTIILTHCHFDHICGLNRIREIRPDAKLIATKLCSEHIGNKYRNMSSSADAFLVFYQQGKKRDAHIESFVCAPADIVFDEEMRRDWQGHHVRLIAVHGHSTDSLLVTIDEEMLFSGDTLLAVPTVTRLPGGSTDRFRKIDLPFLKMLHVNKVFPGHGNPGNLGTMLAINE